MPALSTYTDDLNTDGLAGEVDASGVSYRFVPRRAPLARSRPIGCRPTSTAVSMPGRQSGW